ncbi:MAG: hypothetical protein KAJ58_00675 [Candidatus Pacebacteria bacterium]|nr:hypothetical protein [Candidatus Paceibacterota bacterium]
MNKQLKSDISKYVTQDQYIRNLSLKFPKIKELCSEVIIQDAVTRKFVKKVLNKHKWPTISSIGEKTSHNFWLLVQHMDKDIVLQKKALRFLEEAVDKNEANPKDHAYLKDRILVAENKKQLYGTQWKIENGELFMFSVKDIKNLEKRRKGVGLTMVNKQQEQLKKEYKNILKKVIKKK